MEKVGRLSYDVFLVIMRSLPPVRRQGAICLMRRQIFLCGGASAAGIGGLL